MNSPFHWQGKSSIFADLPEFNGKHLKKNTTKTENILSDIVYGKSKIKGISKKAESRNEKLTKTNTQ